MDEKQGIIQVRGLSKSYGEILALSGVSFSVAAGEVFAYLGPNGAGKTTTISILCGLLSPDAGLVDVCGLKLANHPVEVKSRIGVVPEESNLYPELTCRRNLEYLGELYGLTRKARRQRAAELLDSFSLAEKASRPYKSLSRGMKRRLTIAAALIHSPQVLFLDEPTAGLDLQSARALRVLIREIHRTGTTVFLTTHNLSEAEELAHRVAILLKGRLVAIGTVPEIRRRVSQAEAMSVSFSGQPAVSALLAACPAVKKAGLENGHLRLEVSGTHEALTQLVSFAQSQGIRIMEIATITPSLEEAFLTLVSDPTKGAPA